MIKYESTDLTKYLILIITHVAPQRMMGLWKYDPTILTCFLYYLLC